MTRAFLLTLLLVFTIPSTGCTYLSRNIGAKIDEMSDEELAIKIHDSTEGAVAAGLKLLAEKMPEKKAAILKDAAVASAIIKTNILPIFSGATSNDLVASAIMTALGQLSGKISLEVDGAIRLGYGMLSSKVMIPKIPTDKLSPRVQIALVAFFTGSSEALDDFLAPPPIVFPAPPTVPPWPPR